VRKNNNPLALVFQIYKSTYQPAACISQRRGMMGLRKMRRRHFIRSSPTLDIHPASASSRRRPSLLEVLPYHQAPLDAALPHDAQARLDAGPLLGRRLRSVALQGLPQLDVLIFTDACAG